MPLSRWYCRTWGVYAEPAIFPLPFGFILKSHERVREQEGLAMNLARAMGIPAPRYISFGTLDNRSTFPSLLMTQLSGTPLDNVPDDEVDLDVVVEDLKNILSRMRSFANPWGEAVCGVDGGDVHGPLVPQNFPRCENEVEFRQRFERFSSMSAQVRAFLDLPPHAIVFTHGDLNRHNLMLGADGHISGVFDWEAAAWMPEFWEISVVSLFEARPWSQVMHRWVSGGRYEEELKGHRALLPYISDFFSY